MPTFQVGMGIKTDQHAVCQIKYKEVNLYEFDEKIDYSMIHSDNLESVMKVVKIILKLWDLGKKFGKKIWDTEKMQCNRNRIRFQVRSALFILFFYCY